MLKSCTPGELNYILPSQLPYLDTKVSDMWRSALSYVASIDVDSTQPTAMQQKLDMCQGSLG